MRNAQGRNGHPSVLVAGEVERMRENRFAENGRQAPLLFSALSGRGSASHFDARKNASVGRGIRGLAARSDSDVG